MADERADGMDGESEGARRTKVEIEVRQVELKAAGRDGRGRMKEERGLRELGDADGEREWRLASPAASRMWNGRGRRETSAGRG